ncbi:MAG: LapA family protein [Tissierellia bacterium]|nr:LapA family protein [Tissierellia bacterium]MDD4726341.1 LapA family protein [Tissierellia bacterium]
MEKWFILSLVIAILIGVFAISNGEVVDVNLFLTTIQVSQAIVIFISALLGAVIVAIFETVRIWKLRRQIKDLNKKLTQSGKENDRLLELIKNKDNEIETLVNKNKDEELQKSAFDSNKSVVEEDTNRINSALKSDI